VKSSVEALEGNKVKVSIEVDESEFDRNIDAAFKKIAREVRLPGFRPGKAPRRVLEARIGVEAARQQALNDAIPEYLSQAVREHDVDIVATPDVQLVSGETEGPVRWDATIEIRPEITVAGYAGLRVELPAVEVTDEDIDPLVENEQRRHAKLVDVDRVTQHGDFVTVDLAGSRDGEPAPGLNVEDWSYEIGRGWVAPGFDDQLLGVKAGEELRFTATPNGTEEPADFHIKISRVQEQELPEVTDEWVSEHLAEFDSVEAWREGLRTRLHDMRVQQIRSTISDKITDALAELVDAEVPQSMVDYDLQSRVQNTVEQFRQQSISLDQWLSATGQDTESFVENLRERSVIAVKVDLALRAIASSENITVDDAEIESEYETIAMRIGEKPAKVRRAYEQNGAISELSSFILKQKAFDWLMHNCQFVDVNGKEIPRDTVLPDHDHSHDELDATNVDVETTNEDSQ
jgi:trigger factor